jgi:hypothetical protein
VNYQHGQQLAKFISLETKGFKVVCDLITDSNFRHVSEILVPGKAYKAKIWTIHKGKNTVATEVMQFLKSNNVLFTGAQGISLAWSLHKDKFPNGKWIASMDEQSGLCQDENGKYRIPGIARNPNGDLGFGLTFYDSVFYDNYCFFGICSL